MKPNAVAEEKNLDYWREKTLQTTLVIGISFGFFFMGIPLLLLALHNGQWTVLVLDVSFFGLALIVLFYRAMRYEIRAGCTLVLSYAIGCYIIFYFGFKSTGPIFLFSFAVMAGLLLGSKAAGIAIIVNSITLALFGWLTAMGQYAQDVPFSPVSLRGAVAWCSFMMINTVTAVSVSVNVRGIQSLAVKERSANRKMMEEHENLMREIDARTKAESSLRESEKRYRLIAENASDIIWTLDLNSLKFTYVSPSVYRVRGVTPEETMEQGIEEVLAPGYMDSVTSTLAEEIAREGNAGEDPKRSKTLEIEQRHKNGSYSWAEATMTFIRDDKRRPIEILGVTRDISDRKRRDEEKKALEAKLQQSQKLEAIATLAGGIAHQFNNALSTIQGRLEILELELPQKETKKHLAPAKEMVKRMTHLTRQLLAYARGGKYMALPVLMGRFIRDTLPLIQHTVNPLIHVELDLPQETSSVIVDKTQMQMVLSALLTNASEAINDSGCIRISCKDVMIRDESTELPYLRPGPYVRVTVEDNGRGIDEQAKGRIFDPFFSTKFQGRGLGLAAAYGIIKNHDGVISVDSEPGQGTVVHVYLPVNEEHDVHMETKTDRVRT